MCRSFCAAECEEEAARRIAVLPPGLTTTFEKVTMIFSNSGLRRVVSFSVAFIKLAGSANAIGVA